MPHDAGNKGAGKKEVLSLQAALAEAGLPAAFAPSDIGLLGYVHGFTCWRYRSNSETLAMLAAPGHFDRAQDMFSLGDMIVLSGAWGGVIVFVTALRPHVVLSPPATLPVSEAVAP